MSDPYEVTYWNDQSGFHIRVAADVLPYAGDTTEVQAECRRRAELIRDNLLATFFPGGDRQEESE